MRLKVEESRAFHLGNFNFDLHFPTFDSIPTVQPIFGRPMYGAKPKAAHENSVLFVSDISIKNGEYRR